MRDFRKQNFFIFIKDPVERQEILKSLIRKNTPIYSQVVTTWYTIMPKFLSEENIVCVIDETKLPRGFEDVGVCLFHFQVKSGKYIANASYLYSQGYFYINTKFELFQIQRREDYRLFLPDKFPIKATIFEINNAKTEYNFNVLDLSIGGARISTDNDRVPIVKNDVVSLRMTMPSKEVINLKGTVKYRKQLTATKKLVVGIQFLELEAKARFNIFQLIMEVYRILFSDDAPEQMKK